MQKLLQYQPRLTAIRIMLAFVIALLGDAVQVPVNYILPYFPQLRIVNLIADGLTMILTIGLLGFNWVLLPCVALEMLPLSASLPSWTAAVGWVVWRRRNEAPQSATAPHDPAANPQASATSATARRPPTPEFFNPMKKLTSIAAQVFSAQSHGLWILIMTAALIGGLIYSKHKLRGDRQSGQADEFPLPTAPAPFEFTANATPHAKPSVTVAPVEDQSPAPRSGGERINPERLRALVEDMLAQTEGVELVRAPPAQLHQPVAADRVVFVTLLDARDEAATFTGYNIAAKTLATRCSLRVQIVQAADKTILFSTVLEGSQTEVRTSAASAPVTSDRILRAVKDAIKGMTNNPDLQAALRGEPPSESQR